jgi:molecular chaperone GrpE
MTYPRNGRTIRIPVQTGRRQLPSAGDEKRPMLTGPAGGQQKATGARVETQREAVDWSAYVARLRAELEGAQAQASTLHAELEAWQAHAARLRDREVDVRRQAEHQAGSQVKEERNRLLSRLLAVGDNLEHALAHADKNDPLYAGVRLTLDDLLAQLKKEGVEPMPALGNTFDPNLHEAVATDGTSGHTVVKVLQTGYVRNGELVRPARVVVGSAPS